MNIRNIPAHYVTIKQQHRVILQHIKNQFISAPLKLKSHSPKENGPTTQNFSKLKLSVPVTEFHFSS